MNDRELLEMAAKAYRRSGVKLECPDDPDGIFISRDEIRNGSTWNPLTDDGDALRLACSLGLIIETGLNDGRSSSACDVSCSHHFYLEDHDGDICAGARRAIVMCAAEIGKSM